LSNRLVFVDETGFILRDVRTLSLRTADRDFGFGRPYSGYCASYFHRRSPVSILVRVVGSLVRTEWHTDGILSSFFWFSLPVSLY